MIATIGGRLHNWRAPLWQVREYAEPERRGGTNADRSAQFAERCSQALALLQKQPMGQYELGRAMEWRGSKVWRVLDKLEADRKIERYLEAGRREWLYRSLP